MSNWGATPAPSDLRKLYRSKFLVKLWFSFVEFLSAFLIKNFCHFQYFQIWLKRFIPHSPQQARSEMCLNSINDFEIGKSWLLEHLQSQGVTEIHSQETQIWKHRHNQYISMALQDSIFDNYIFLLKPNTQWSGFAKQTPPKRTPAKNGGSSVSSRRGGRREPAGTGGTRWGKINRRWRIGGRRQVRDGIKILQENPRRNRLLIHRRRLRHGRRTGGFHHVRAPIRRRRQRIRQRKRIDLFCLLRWWSGGNRIGLDWLRQRQLGKSIGAVRQWQITQGSGSNDRQIPFTDLGGTAGQNCGRAQKTYCGASS